MLLDLQILPVIQAESEGRKNKTNSTIYARHNENKRDIE